MNYNNAQAALEDCRALTSLIEHHHGPHHIMTDNRFTYDYAVSKCRYVTSSTAGEQSSFTIHGFKDCHHQDFHTFIMRDSFQSFLNIFEKNQLDSPRVTKKF